ncbi:MAG TPA: hypothetical protein VGN81_06835 [Pseudonocardiaceae bacterium]
MTSSPPHAQLLEAAGFIAGPPAIKGIPLWRTAGIRSVRLLVERFLDLVANHGRPTVVEHPFLASASADRDVFGSYDNSYELLDLAGQPGTQFRSDNIVSSVHRLRSADHDQSVVSVGTILRHNPGKTLPLFRDRSIWPVVELNQLATEREALELLDFYALVMEDLLWSIGIPSVTVHTPELSSYGKKTYLTVTALPDKRPTVLATLYILSEEIRSALGVDEDVIDVGFTGKLLGTTAMLHVDARGLVLPSTIAPVQVGVTLAADTRGSRSDRWLAALEQSGIRCDTSTATGGNGRARAERAWHRRGVPLVIGLDRTPGSVTVCTRKPLVRTELMNLPGPNQVRALLAESDTRLRDGAAQVFDSAMAEGGHLRSLCRSCADAADVAPFGHVVTSAPVHCERCSDTQAQRLFVSDEGRFY